MRRDYRIASLDNPCGCGVYAEGYCSNFKSFWHKQELTAATVRGHRTYSTVIEPPTDGRYLAYFIDIKYRRNLMDVPTGQEESEVRGQSLRYH